MPAGLKRGGRDAANMVINVPRLRLTVRNNRREYA
jgi:hypothetical protein